MALPKQSLHYDSFSTPSCLLVAKDLKLGTS